MKSIGLFAWGRALRARPRLAGAMGLGVSVFWALPLFWALPAGTRLLLAWNAGALTYLLLVVHMARAADAHGLRQHALRENEGAYVILTLVVLAAAAVLLAVGSQLAAVRDMHGAARQWHIGLGALTVTSAWLITHTLFALHYAHAFYFARVHHRPDPLAFPGTPEPDYGDFFHFAIVIGTSGQTADISFCNPALRGVGTLHCALAFFFNATLLALTINLAAGLL